MTSDTPSLVARRRADLETQGDFVALANISSGWFAVFQSTWQARVKSAKRAGREGPRLIVYRTKSGDPRDHYVVPYRVVRDLLVDETITHSNVNGSDRWNLTLKDHQLHVTHRSGRIDVSAFFGAELPGERVAFLIPEEVEPEATLREGAVRQILVNAYERDREARARCLKHYGRRCAVCDMAFAEVYGDEFASIIHVHHVVPLSAIALEYVVDPIRDLRPVCPNCHAVIHSRTPPYTIEQATQLLTRSSASAAGKRQ